MRGGLTFLPLFMIVLGLAMLYAGLTGKSAAVIQALKQ